MARVVVDPIPRIEGHLRIEVEVENGKVKDAWSTGTLFRGLEIILQGRDPRDAHLITQRSCGVCTLVHSLASVRAVEDALKIKVPPNARIIRNLTHAAQNMHDHPVHFYQLCALDWVDVVSALEADPGKTADLSFAVSGRPQTKKYYEGLKGKLKAFVDSGQLGPFANAYWKHPQYKLPAEANLMAVGHYLDNLRQQVHAAQMTAIWGAKNPHLQGHLPGGVTIVEQLNADRISQYLYMLREQIKFIEEVYIPDLLAVASFYKDWAKIGGNKNFLAYGDFPQGDDEPASFLFPQRHDHERGPQNRAVRCAKDHGRRGPRLVRGRETAPSFSRRDQAADGRQTERRCSGHESQRREIYMAQGPEIRRGADGGRSTGTVPRLLRERT